MIVSALVLALGVAGCDKCGNRVQFVAPSVQHVCGDGAQGR